MASKWSRMLVLSSLNRLLEQVVSPSDVHTAVLLTPSGELVSFASSTTRPKDEIRILLGLSREAWLETQGDEEGMLDSEMGRLLVVPIIPSDKVDASPVMLLTLNAAKTVDWGILQIKGQSLASHLSKPLSELSTIPSSSISAQGSSHRRR